MDTQTRQSRVPMPPLNSFYPTGYPPMMPPPPPELFQTRPHPLRTYSMESVSSYSDMEDPKHAISPQEGLQRSRRRHPPRSEHIKHRRTRSGCYTCRQRRVKCDETRPVCDRCRKGKRDCTYPGSSSASKPKRETNRSKSSSANDGSSPSGDELDGDDKDILPSIPDDDEDYIVDESEPKSATTEHFPRSDSCANSDDANTSSSNTTPTISHAPKVQRTNSDQYAMSSLAQKTRWLALPKDVRTLLNYHRESLSYHHYAFKYDRGDFLKTTFLEIALNDESEALLYAVVAFAAYHHNLAQQDSGISNFLSYYNKSINKLGRSLKSRKPNVTTLLTILQLATIEEFLGDWVNLLGHQRAAHQILTELFTPQSIVQDETRRQIIGWYVRFDLFAGMMSGDEMRLGREWLESCRNFYKCQVRDRPDDLGAIFEQYFATTRLLAADYAMLMAATLKNTGNEEQLTRKSGELVAQFAEFSRELESVFSEPSNFVKIFRSASQPTEEHITDYQDPNFLYRGKYFTMNYILLDFWSIDLMMKHHLIHRDPAELARLALKMCKMIEAIEHSDQGSPGAILGCQSCLGIAGLFLPKDQKHIDWVRRKFALIEHLGYIYPEALRKRMSEVWDVDFSQLWLPNDKGYPPAVIALRDFIEYRAAVPLSVADVHLRDMNGLFRGLEVNEHINRPNVHVFDPQVSPTMTHGSNTQFWRR